MMPREADDCLGARRAAAASASRHATRTNRFERHIKIRSIRSTDRDRVTTMSRFATPPRCGPHDGPCRSATALMNSLPLVPVEGTLARPRATPLDGVPPFGREWTFRGMSGARSGNGCLATLTTSCIDIDAPHRACRWQPLPATSPSGGVPAIAPGATRRNIQRAGGRAQDRRALRVACWSVGALGIIGWLVAAHEPFPAFAPAPAMQAAATVPEHIAQSAETMRAATVPRTKPASAPTQQTAARPVAESSRPAPRASGALPKTAPRRADARSEVRRVAAASPPQLSPLSQPSSPHLRAGQRMTLRRAAEPSTTQFASRAPSRDHLAPPSRPHAPPQSLDDPLTLIAMAHALDAARAAQPAHSPAADFDWTAQLSHRRLSDTRGTPAR
ncbi:hypothetical protein [Burkholderia latens]|uniref:hypothetical protein n=1 Tax=Burkholderia latens TaxID=488446 RepID=UPI001FC87FA3|nr:hypothetical protein [Burkholderia latens]